MTASTEITLSPELRRLADSAGAAYGEAVRLGRMAIDEYLTAGRFLIEAKGKCQHGQWGRFLDLAGIPQRTARNAMRLARSGLKTETVAVLGGVRAVLESPLTALALEFGPGVGEAVLEFMDTGLTYEGALRAVLSKCQDEGRAIRQQAETMERLASATPEEIEAIMDGMEREIEALQISVKRMQDNYEAERRAGYGLRQRLAELEGAAT